MLRRLVPNRIIRTLLWILFTAFTLVVLLGVWINWSGGRRWASVSAEVARHGEGFDFQKLLPPTPPAAENLLAIEPLNGMAEVIEGDEKRGEPGAKREALRALKLPVSPGKPPVATGVTLGKTVDLPAWVGFLRESKFLDLPATPAPTAREVLTALDSKFPLLRQVAEEAARRPHAAFTPGLRERQKPGLLMNMPVPYFEGAMQLGRVLVLRAHLAVAAGDSATATQSILTTLRLARACEREPLLIGFLVATTLQAQASEPLWLGLRERAFAEEDLRRLRQGFQSTDIAGTLLSGLRGELAAGVNAVEQMQIMTTQKKEESPSLIDTMYGSNLSGMGMVIKRGVPGGLFDHWKSALVEVELRQLILPLKQGGLMQAVQAGAAAEAEMEKKSSFLRHPDMILAKLMIPAVVSVNLNALVAETRLRQVITATALEQFFGKHGRYPAALTELAPEFLPSVPADPCGGQPLRYRTLPTGRYRLWSIGIDLKDNDGKVTLDAKGETRLNKREYKGDWTWQYEPVESMK